jgi:hypothetical protein
MKILHQVRGEKRAEFPRCFRTLVVKIEKTNSNSTRDFSKRINFTRVHLFVWSTLVVKIKKTQESTPIILGEHNFTTVVSLLSTRYENSSFGYEMNSKGMKSLKNMTNVMKPTHF